MKKLTYENIAHAKELNVYLEQGNRVLDALGYTDHSQKHTAKISAIGQHDERSGIAFDPLSAALILADKSDVRRDRVRNTVPETFDKHDRVNYAALSSKLHVDTHKKVITLNIELDE